MTSDDEKKQPFIRLAMTTDVPAIKLIARKSFERYVPLIGKPPAPMNANFSGHVLKDTVFIAQSEKKQGSVLGYAIVLQRDGEWLLDNIAVSPEAQGRGIGSALIAACETFLQKQGVQRYHLYTNEAMEQNLTWYPEIGFVEMARRLEDGFSRIYFTKEMVPKSVDCNGSD
jgi:ribosomal protein S18 acetylase RimI-like enzyme